jgi:hypothetical protein
MKYRLFRYPYESNGIEMLSRTPPLHLACTQFHFILLYSDRVRIISRLNDKIVWEALIPDQVRLCTSFLYKRITRQSREIRR